MTRGLVTSLVVLLALAAAPPVAAQTPGTLTGTVLNGGANPSLGIGAVAIDCEPAGTSTVTYTVVGAALGPYPGTYEVTEDAKDGFALSSITCDDSNSTVDMTTSTATINVEAGE